MLTLIRLLHYKYLSAASHEKGLDVKANRGGSGEIGKMCTLAKTWPFTNVARKPR